MSFNGTACAFRLCILREKAVGVGHSRHTCLLIAKKEVPPRRPTIGILVEIHHRACQRGLQCLAVTFEQPHCHGPDECSEPGKHRLLYLRYPRAFLSVASEADGHASEQIEDDLFGDAVVLMEYGVASDEGAQERSPWFREAEYGRDDGAKGLVAEDEQTQVFAVQVAHANDETKPLWPWFPTEEDGLNDRMSEAYFGSVDDALSQAFDRR